MTSASGPPSYPPYGPPPHGGGPSRGSSTPTIVTALLAALFVVATALAAWGVHAHGTRSAADAPALGASGSLQTDSGEPAGASASFSVPSTSLNIPTPTYPTYPTTSYVPPPTTTPIPTPTPTFEPLNTEAINRTFQVFMNGLINRSLQTVKSVTCPKLRKKTKGTALNRKYISRWKGGYYTLYPGRDYVIYPVTVRYVDPNTGGDGKTGRYRFYVDRYPDGRYWVCGFL